MPAAPAAEALGLYYDRLSRYLLLAGGAGHGGGAEGLSMHRALAPPGSAARADPGRLDDLILDRCPLPPNARVLDAGCGLGGTIFRWQARHGGSHTGITLSAVQRDRAAAEAERRGVSGTCRFLCQSYDRPPEGPFDAVVAIESLAHSAAPAGSIAALARVLAPGGVLIVADDVPTAAAAGDPDYDRFRAGWHCPALATQAALHAAFAAAGLALVHDEDLSAWLRPRRPTAIAVLAALNAAACTAIPHGAVRMVLRSHRGGLALERLHRRGLMQYRLLVARSPAA